MVTGRLGRVRRNLVAILLPACTMGLLAQGCHGPTQTARVACALCEGQDRMVRLQHRDAVSGRDNLPFTHPFSLAPEDWTLILKRIRVQRQNLIFFMTTKGAVEPLFTDEDVAYLSATLSRVFARAQPDEWVVFALSRSQSSEVKAVTTGVWFVQGPSLRLVLAHHQYATTMPTVRERIWEYPLHPDSDPPYDFVSGEFQTAGEADTPHARLFPLSLPALSIAYQPLLLGELSSQATEPKYTVPERLPTSQSRTPSPDPSLEERLQRLKRLWEQGLITQADYEAKKKELLDRL